MWVMTTEQQPTDWREGRRLRAWDLHKQGWPNKQIAAALGVTEGAVSQWLKRARLGGKDALRNRVRPGAQPRLTTEQRASIPALLKRGAEAYGFLGDVWTQARVASVIRQEFGVSYHHDHIGRLLRSLGWSVQKPIERASERNGLVVARWREETWPEIKKKPKSKDAHSSG